MDTSKAIVKVDKISGNHINEVPKFSREQIYAIKAIAVFGVVTAHGTAVPDGFSNISTIISAIWQSIGSMGVGIFFCMSGYLLIIGTSRYLSFPEFFWKKLITLGIPWLISAVLVYLYVAVRKGGSLLGMLVSILGYGASYWYMSILMILYVVFYFVIRSKHYRIYCISVAVLAVVSVLLRRGGIIQQDAFGVYLNVFNWGIFFVAGIFLVEIKNSTWQIIYKAQWLCYILSFILLLLFAINKKTISYFSLYYIPYELLVILSVLFMSKALMKGKVLVKIGMASFSIYLYNECPWAGLIAHICDQYDIWLLVLIRPFVVLALTYAMLYFGYSIFEKLGHRKLYFQLTGFKI